MSAWVVIWLMIYQRLDTKGTLSVAVREMLVGSVRQYVPRAEDAEPLSANTSAYSQARSKLPVDMAEKASDMIFDGLRQQPTILSGLGQPMFLLDGSSIQLPHTPELMAAYPPQMIAPAHGNVISNPDEVLPVIREAFEQSYAESRQSQVGTPDSVW